MSIQQLMIAQNISGGGGSMALKTTGQATELLWVLAVHPVANGGDGLVHEWVSSAVDGDMTINANVTYGSTTWKGETYDYFETFANGAFDFYGLTFGTNKPTLPRGNTQAGLGGLGIGFIMAGSGAGSSNRAFLATDASSLVSRASDKASWTNGNPGTTSLPSDGTTKYHFGSNYVYNANADWYYGLESGSLAADGTNNPGGFGSDSELVVSIGGWAGQGSHAGKYLMVYCFESTRTLSEFQALHDNGLTELFDIT